MSSSIRIKPLLHSLKLQIIAMQFVFLLPFIFFSQFIIAQIPFSIKEDRINLGKIENWRNDTAWFYIQNTSNRAWYLLPKHLGMADFQLIYSRRLVNPDELAPIGIVHYTEKEGIFKIKTSVYISSWDEPIDLTYTGNILSFHPNALVACPTVNGPNSEEIITAKIEKNLKKDKREEVPENIEVDEYNFEDSFVEEDELLVQRDEEIKETFNDAFSSNAPINNIILVLDKSRSMAAENKMSRLKASIIKLIYALREQDQITVLTYSRVVKIPISSNHNASKSELVQVVNDLKADGGSYGNKAMTEAFEIARKSRVRDGNNAIILATDGKFNDRDFSEEDLYKEAKRASRYGISLSGIAFGEDPRALDFLKILSESGRGTYVEVESQMDSDQMIIDMINTLSKNLQ